MAEPSPPTGTVILLFTDIEGSTKRWEHLPAAMSAALAQHDTLLRGAIEARGGFVFKTIGDAFCAAFADPAAAVAASLDAQHALAAEAWGEVGHVRVRMALHSGAPEHRDRDYFGPPVNRVARLLATGAGGQVLLSDATAALVGGRLPDGTSLVDLGAHRLKDLLQPQRVFQLAAPGLAADFPPLKSLDRQPHNLPAQPTPLIGREAEVARVRAIVEEPAVRLATLTGPGGTGKTRLALQVAAELVEAFADGTWFVDLAPLSHPDLVVPAIAQPLGVRESGHEPLEATLLDYLRDKRLLLVLDNCEHLLGAVPAIGRLLAACRDVRALATSRAALRVYGEREVAVQPLALPDPRRLPPPAELAKIEAVALFVERATAVKPGFDLTEGNAAAIAGICTRLEGLPLAIELAAARARVLPPEQLLARLTSRLALLTGGASDRDERQRTLRGAIAWSHDLLPPAQQALFRRLAVFAGGCAFEAVEAVCDADGSIDALDGLDALVAQSLVRHDEGAAGEGRFRMLETIREFATERLEASGEAAAVRQAHGSYFLALAEEAEPALTGPEQAAWLDRLETEHDNLRAALTWLGENGGPEEELRLAGSLWRFWDVRGYLTEGRIWLERALTNAEEASPGLRATALNGLGVITWTLGDVDRSIERHQQALTLARLANDEIEVARALDWLGWIAADRGNNEQAVKLFDEALAGYRSLGYDRGTASVLHALAEVGLSQGDHDRARALAEESLALWRRLGEPLSIGLLIQFLGMLAFVGEQYELAVVRYEESLAIHRGLGDRLGTARVLANLARAVEGLGAHERATALFEEALADVQELGDKGGEAFVLYGKAHLAQESGDTNRARMLYAESIALYRQIGEQDAVGWCLEGLAGVTAKLGQAPEAVLLLGVAEAVREAIGAPLPTTLLADHKRTLASVRLVLDEATIADALMMGRIMSPDQALSEIGVVAA